MREFKYLLAISIIICVFGCSAKQSVDDRFVTLKVYHTNDIHSRLLPDGKHRGGLAYLASVLRIIREQDSQALILDAGDFYKRGSMPAQKSQDEATADILSQMSFYDARALGNNEIKVGIERFLDWSKNKEPAPIIAANFVDKNGAHVFEPYLVIKKSGLTIGLIGLTEIWSIDNEFQPSTKDDAKAPYKILDPLETVGPLIVKLRPQVDVLIVVAHQAFKKNEALAKKYPQVDLVVSGHAHQLSLDQKKLGENMVVEAGEFGHQLGVVTVVYDKNIKKVNSLESTFWPIGEEMQVADLKIEAAIKSAYKKWAPEAFEVLTQAQTELGVINNLNRHEGALSNFVVDLITSKNNAQVGFINSAFVREGIQKGKVLRDHLWMSIPFEDQVMTATLPRLHLQEMLQESITSYYKNTSFVPFAFSNIKASLKLDPLNRNLLSSKVTIVSKKDSIKVALPSYIVNHCREFFKEKYCPIQAVETGVEIRKLVEETFLATKNLEAPQLNRVSVTDR